MENSCFVYKHTNMENGLVYYGIAEDFETRWDDGFGYQTNRRFWKDIVKYGWNNFKHEIIFENISRDSARFFEGMLIQETQSYLPENGYNQNLGERMQYREVNPDADLEINENSCRPRRGRSGVPVYYDGKIYLTIKELCDEISEDSTVISQMLNPNSPRKLAPYLEAKGLRYASDTEIQKYCESIDS